ncbi:hypothetical protein FD733_19425 (plasmid) [Pantoea sp. Eser]|nr:hypothetical protein [Pantoea sp. Eser]
MMIINRDLYTQVVYENILSSGLTLGKTIIQYEVKCYTDTRNLKSIKSYLIECTQRFIFTNQSPYTLAPGPVNSFTDYPVLLSNNIQIIDSQNVMADISVIDYSPRTLNTAVSTNQNLSSSSGSSTTRQYSRGASNSQTNSYSFSGSGSFDEMVTGSLGGKYSHSNTDSSFSSKSRGNSSEHGSQVSNSSGMTIKDWGSYASLDADNYSPTWVWGQEYPWNVILFKATDNNNNIKLPQFIQQRLWDGEVLYPPSELSLFGIDFVSKVTWLLTPGKPLLGNELLTFEHTLTYGAGTHRISNNKLSTNLNIYEPIVINPKALDLPVLALDPLSGQSNNYAIIGFVANRFDVQPTSTGSTFAITADTNDLIVRGSGFNSILGTDFSTGDVGFAVYFKITDINADISLHIKHWTQNNSAVRLTIVINGNNDAAMMRFVDAPETGSGNDNITVVALRNRNMVSVDYCDQIQTGLNNITITAAAVNSPANWQILALAVG